MSTPARSRGLQSARRRINAGAHISGTFMGGFIWGENVGWLNLDDLTPGKFVSVEAAFVPIDCDMNHDSTVNGLDIQPFTDFFC